MRATPALRRSVLKVLDQDVQRTFHFGDREPKTGHIMHMTATIPGIFDMATGKLVNTWKQEEAAKATQCCLWRILLGDSHRAICIGGPTTCTPHFADASFYGSTSAKRSRRRRGGSIELRPAKPVVKPQSRRSRINRPG